MLPPSRPSPPFVFSRLALAITVGALLLGVLLATMTVRNIRREERLMHTFLLHEGQALIRALEAGARTTIMHMMGSEPPVATLVAETVKEPSVAYIRIVDARGNMVATAGDWPAATRPRPDKVLAGDAPITTAIDGVPILDIASPFTPLALAGPGPWMMGRWRRNCGLTPGETATPPPQVIYLGLRTEQFDQARRVDLRHALLLGGILFLAGSAGFYLLFLYQTVRVTRRTLTDMEVYTEIVIASIPDGLVTLDQEGRVVSANRRATEILGLAPEAIRGRPFAEAVAPWPLPAAAEPPLVDHPLECRNADGAPIPVRVSTALLRDRDQRLIGMVIIIRDVRELHDMRQRLERAHRLAALGRMAAGIAHEIRNPLGTLRGFAQYFAGRAEMGSTEWQYANLMVEEVDRLNRTVSALLQFARPRPPQFEPVRLAAVAEATIHLLEGDFQHRAVACRLEAADDEPEIEADPDLLRQVLINLLQNSLAACDAGDTVTVTIRQQETSVVLQVTDSGRGMTAEEREHMFDPFFTTKKSGTGLGLAVVHQIVEQHRGTIKVSTRPGGPTTVEIHLPLCQEGTRTTATENDDHEPRT